MKRTFTDNELIKMLRNGESSRRIAMKELVLKYRPRVFNHLKPKLGQEDAEDMASHIVVNLIENILDRKFKGNSSINTYVWAITRNQLRKRYAKFAREDISAGRLPPEAEQDNPEVISVRKEQEQAVSALMEKLKPSCRNILRFWTQKYRMDEIAEKLGFKSASVVRTLKRRCFQQLLVIIDNDPEISQRLNELRP